MLAPTPPHLPPYHLASIELPLQDAGIISDAQLVLEAGGPVIDVLSPAETPSLSVCLPPGRDGQDTCDGEGASKCCLLMDTV